MAEPQSTPDRLLRRMSALEGLRQPYESEMRTCFDYTYPERSSGLEGGMVTGTNDARGKRAQIFDDTVKDAGRTLASSVIGGMTPANSIWFGMDAGGSEQDVEARWLSDASQFLFDNIHSANFDSSSFECAMDMVNGGGYFVQYIEEAPEGGYRFEQWPVGQCFISSTRSGGRVDTIYRRFTMTVEQCVSEWGVDAMSERTRELHATNKLDEPVDILWSIEPRQAVKAGGSAKLAKNKPFASVKLEVGAKHVIVESGYDEFPCAVPRWMLIPGSHYASSPVSACLATVKTLNKIKELDLINFEMSAYGMFKAKDDGVLNPFTTVIGPRRVVVVADMENFEPIQPGGNAQLSQFVAADMQATIRKMMLADVLQPQDGPAMTATEVHARMMLLRQQLGPIFGRLQAEWLRALIERCFGIAYRAGALTQACGPIPQSLTNRIVNVHYSSPLARAQKLEEVVAIDSWVTGLVQYAGATQDMSGLDEIDQTFVAEFKREALGVPSRAQRTEDQVAQIRQQRMQAQQAAQQQAQQQQMQTAAGEAVAKQAATAQG
jgi:hypothetical protein